MTNETEKRVEVNEKMDLTAFEIVSAESNELLPRENNKKKGKALKVVLTTCTLFLLAVVGALVYITEPWIEPTPDEYFGIIESINDEVALSVGDTYTVDVPLGENEEIKSITVKDEDILKVEGNMVTALGEYFKTNIVVVTQEKKVPERELREFVLFGKDFTEEYNYIRDYLRDQFNIEPMYVPRTELRELNSFTIPVAVSGHAANVTTEKQITAYSGDKKEISLELAKDEVVFFTSDDEKIATVSENNGKYTVKAEAVGETELTGVIGYWKEVDEETYATYLSATGKEADEENPNKIFVPQRSIKFPVKFTKKPTPKPVVTTPTTPVVGSSGGGSSGSSNGGGSSGPTALSSSEISAIVAAGNAAFGSRYWAEANYYGPEDNIIAINKSYDQVLNEVLRKVAAIPTVGRVFSNGYTIIVAYSF